MRLGSSSRSPTIVGLVLEHLCPAVQNILEDGLRDHKLDLIIGQRRNHSWSVVEASATTGNAAPRFFFTFFQKISQSVCLVECQRLSRLPLPAGPSTRVLQSLVSKIRRCPQLSSNCMKLRAFVMGLLK